MPSNAEHLVRLSRLFCAEKLPWFAPAIFSCRVELTERVPVAAISERLTVFWNPTAIEAIENAAKDKAETLARLGFLWAHEISHVLREHGQRARDANANHEIWNIAADLEINDSNWAGLAEPLPFEGVFPKTFDLPDGQITEWYYRKLFENGHVREVAVSWDSGSGAHGQPRPWETDGGPGEADPSRLEQVRMAVAKLMDEHQKSQGNLPGGWARWAEERLRARVDWRKVLRHRVRSAVATSIGGRTDYTSQRPSRRQSVFDPLLPPSLRVDWQPRIACVIDTSGSMSATDIGQAVAEALRILEEFRVPIQILPCDAAAHEALTVAAPSDLFQQKSLVGGGGTDMTAGIDAALKLRPAPDAVVVLTDGWTNYPPVPPRTPVLFGIIEQARGSEPPLPARPPWAEDSVIRIRLAE